MPNKKCKYCSKQLVRKVSATNGRLERAIHFSARKFCDKKCYGKYISPLRKGKIYHDKSPFVKGHKFFSGGEKGWFQKGHKFNHNNRASGSKHYNWKGGITSENEKIRKSNKYKLWRTNVMKRDNYICQFCKVVGGRLSVDHIKPFSLYPELRFDMDNGRTLCWECHKKTDTFAGKMIKYRKEKANVKSSSSIRQSRHSNR